MSKIDVYDNELDFEDDLLNALDYAAKSRSTVIQFETLDNERAFAEYLPVQDIWQVVVEA